MSDTTVSIDPMEPEQPEESEADVLPSILGALFASQGSETHKPAPGTESAEAEVGLETDIDKTDSADSADSMASVQAVDPLDSGGPPGLKTMLEWAAVIVSAFVLSLLVRQFLFQAFYIESESMETTLIVKDRVLVNRLSYQWGDFSRGDVIVFARLPTEPGDTRDLIKRVIGLPGEEVEGRNNAVYINGSRLLEPYVDDENMFFADFGPVLVPDGELFVMGDNRDNSLDSRRFGTIDMDRAAGRAFIKFWPPAQLGSL